MVFLLSYCGDADGLKSVFGFSNDMHSDLSNNLIFHIFKADNKEVIWNTLKIIMTNYCKSSFYLFKLYQIYKSYRHTWIFLSWDCNFKSFLSSKHIGLHNYIELFVAIHTVYLPSLFLSGHSIQRWIHDRKTRNPNVKRWVNHSIGAISTCFVSQLTLLSLRKGSARSHSKKTYLRKARMN